MESTAIMLLRFTMKLVNFAMAIAGIPMLLYGIWMATVWHKDIQDSSIEIDTSASPWFIYTSLGIGIALCFIACLGHVSADSDNDFCLSCYTVIVLVLIFLETAVAADILNPVWDLPEDPTGRFRDFKEFLESNFGFFKWVFFLLLLAQGTSVVLAMALRALGDTYRSNFERNENHLPDEAPLINQELEPPSYILKNRLLR